MLNTGNIQQEQFMRLIYRVEITSDYIRDGSKFIGYPGRDHRQGGDDFFSKKIRGAQTFFRKKLGGGDFFLKKIRGAKTFFRK